MPITPRPKKVNGYLQCSRCGRSLQFIADPDDSTDWPQHRCRPPGALSEVRPFETFRPEDPSKSKPAGPSWLKKPKPKSQSEEPDEQHPSGDAAPDGGAPDSTGGGDTGLSGCDRSVGNAG